MSQLRKLSRLLTVDNEADDLDAFHDAGEVIESFPKRRSASIGVRRELVPGIWMKGKSGGVVVAHRIDVLLDDLYYLFAHDVSESYPQSYRGRVSLSVRS